MQDFQTCFKPRVFQTEVEQARGIGTARPPAVDSPDGMYSVTKVLTASQTTCVCACVTALERRSQRLKPRQHIWTRLAAS